MGFVTRDAADGVRFDGAAGEGGRVRVLFVCLGNICRSPTAEGVMRALVREAGLERQIELDSAGTGGWHIGAPPDARATEAARRRGITLAGAARQVRRSDFEKFDLILAMDRSNLHDLQRMAPDEHTRKKVRLLREFDERAGSQSSDGDLDVPDPYYGGPGGFDRVLDVIHAPCVALLEELRPKLRDSRPRQESPPRRQPGDDARLLDESPFGSRPGDAGLSDESRFGSRPGDARLSDESRFGSRPGDARLLDESPSRSQPGDTPLRGESPFRPA